MVATGAEPLIPPIPGIGAAHVHDAQRFLTRRARRDGGCKVAIVGGSATGCEAAELLADHGVSVTILEMRSSVGHGIEAITRRHLLRGLKKAGVQILTKAKVVAFEPDHVLYEDADGATHAVDSDLVGLAIGWKPRGSVLADGLAGRRGPRARRRRATLRLRLRDQRGRRRGTPTMTTLLKDDLLDPEVNHDPYPFLARLREEDPVHYSEAHRAWLVTRYDDVVAAFGDKRLSSDRVRPLLKAMSPEKRAKAGPVMEMIAEWMVTSDPPEPHAPAQAHDQGLPPAQVRRHGGPHPRPGRRLHRRLHRLRRAGPRRGDRLPAAGRRDLAS